MYLHGDNSATNCTAVGLLEVPMYIFLPVWSLRNIIHRDFRAGYLVKAACRTSFWGGVEAPGGIEVIRTF